MGGGVKKGQNFMLSYQDNKTIQQIHFHSFDMNNHWQTAVSQTDSSVFITNPSSLILPNTNKYYWIASRLMHLLFLDIFLLLSIQLFSSSSSPWWIYVFILVALHPVCCHLFSAAPLIRTMEDYLASVLPFLLLPFLCVCRWSTRLSPEIPAVGPMKRRDGGWS